MNIQAFKAVVADGKQFDLEAFLTTKKEAVLRDFFDKQKIMNVNVFLFRQELYCYIESVDSEILPNRLFDGAEQYLQAWPDGNNRYYRPMTTVFHFNEPQSVSHWMRKQTPDYCFGMIARLIPDSIARYIFYHYQLQEEQPGNGDKYGRIFLSGDTAFFYGEIPELIEAPWRAGALQTHNTPNDDEWQELMGSHFIWWDNKRYPACNIKEYDWEKDGYPLGRCNHQWLYLKNIFSVV